MDDIKLLIVYNDVNMCETLSDAFGEKGYVAAVGYSVGGAVLRAEREGF